MVLKENSRQKRWNQTKSYVGISTYYVASTIYLVKLVRVLTIYVCHPPKKLDDGYIRRNPTGYLYATVHRPSASMDHLDHGIRSDLLPKASARPRLDPRGEQSEAANSLRTSLAEMFELVATGRLVWREGGGHFMQQVRFFFTPPPSPWKVAKPAAITAADASNNYIDAHRIN
jgi:hypothetical protein